MSMLLLLAVPQGATQLSFTTQPQAVNAGATMSSVVVKALTAGGVVDAGFTGSITLALTSAGGATLGGTVAVAASAGVATFSDLTVDIGGSYTLTATATGLTSAVSDSFQVRQGALDGLAATAFSYGSMYRRCRAAYTGSLFRLVRASDSAEQDFGFAAGTDVLDVAAVTAWLDGTTGKVVTIYDQSGNSRSPTQGTNGNRPAYAATGLNSKPAAQFTGSSSHYLAAAYTAAQLAYGNAVYATFSNGGVATGKSAGLAGWGNLGSAAVNYMSITDAADVEKVRGVVAGAGEVVFSSDDITGDTTPHIGEFRSISNVSRRASTDGAAEGTATASSGTAPTCNRFAIGCGIVSTVQAFFTGYIGEWVALTTAPSAADRNLIGEAFESDRGYTWNTVS